MYGPAPTRSKKTSFVRSRAGCTSCRTKKRKVRQSSQTWSLYEFLYNSTSLLTMTSATRRNHHAAAASKPDRNAYTNRRLSISTMPQTGLQPSQERQGAVQMGQISALPVPCQQDKVSVAARTVDLTIRDHCQPRTTAMISGLSFNLKRPTGWILLETVHKKAVRRKRARPVQRSCGFNHLPHPALLGSSTPRIL